MLDQSLIDELARFPSPAVADAIDHFNVRGRDEGVTNGSLRCLTPPAAGPAVGYAATARITTRSDAASDDRISASSIGLIIASWKHVLAQPAPRIMVVEDVDDEPGFGTYWGDVNAHIHLALGCQGVVTNGAVRDLPGIEVSGFKVFGDRVAVSHGYARILEVGVAVTVAGLRVDPGDLLHADMHGVVSVPLDLVPLIPDEIRKREVQERRIINFCQSPDFTIDALAEAIGLPRISKT